MKQPKAMTTAMATREMMNAIWLRTELHKILERYGIEPRENRALCALEILTLLERMIDEAGR